MQATSTRHTSTKMEVGFFGGDLISYHLSRVGLDDDSSNIVGKCYFIGVW